MLRVRCHRSAEKTKMILSRKNTLKGDTSGITEKDDIRPRKYGISVEIPYRLTLRTATLLRNRL